MRTIIFLGALLIGAVLVTASPLKDGNPRRDEEDFHLVSDDDGHIHLVDIHPLDVDIEPKFDALTSVVFRLFTRSNPTVAQIINLNNDAQLTNSNFDANREIRFHAHGWNSGSPISGAFVRNALLVRGDFNVFTVDWGAGSNTPEYALARSRVNSVGAVLALYADWINTRGVPFASMSAIGLSLGAHVVGAAGKRTSGTFASIVALDPAGPLFSYDFPQDRIHHTDANHVEVIYTDIDQLGFGPPIGHANFYPNWGTAQPGCENNDAGGYCSHVLASEFYTESINPANIFGAIRCSGFNDIRTRNCTVSGASRRMGGEPVVDGISAPESVFFLTTVAARPFAQGPR